MDELNKKIKNQVFTDRPIGITLLCSINLLGIIVISIASLVRPTYMINEVGIYFPIIILAIIATIGLWKMRKWSVYLYFLGSFADLAIRFGKGNWDIPTLFIFLIINLYLYKRLNIMI